MDGSVIIPMPYQYCNFLWQGKYVLCSNKYLLIDLLIIDYDNVLIIWSHIIKAVTLGHFFHKIEGIQLNKSLEHLIVLLRIIFV